LYRVCGGERSVFKPSDVLPCRFVDLTCCWSMLRTPQTVALFSDKVVARLEFGKDCQAMVLSEKYVMCCPEWIAATTPYLM
jgi:hypothetical protein